MNPSDHLQYLINLAYEHPPYTQEEIESDPEIAAEMLKYEEAVAFCEHIQRSYKNLEESSLENESKTSIIVDP